MRFPIKSKRFAKVENWQIILSDSDIISRSPMPKDVVKILPLKILSVVRFVVVQLFYNFKIFSKKTHQVNNCILLQLHAYSLFMIIVALKYTSLSTIQNN